MWVLSDEPAAMAWLASSSLPESYKERILEIPVSMRQFGARGARAAESSAGEEEAASAAIGEAPPGSDLVELPGS